MMARRVPIKIDKRLRETQIRFLTTPLDSNFSYHSNHARKYFIKIFSHIKLQFFWIDTYALLRKLSCNYLSYFQMTLISVRGNKIHINKFGYIKGCIQEYTFIMRTPIFSKIFTNAIFFDTPYKFQRQKQFQNLLKFIFSKIHNMIPF